MFFLRVDVLQGIALSVPTAHVAPQIIPIAMLLGTFKNEASFVAKGFAEFMAFNHYGAAKVRKTNAGYVIDVGFRWDMPTNDVNEALTLGTYYTRLKEDISGTKAEQSELPAPMVFNK